jgi:hypothetical protein
MLMTDDVSSGVSRGLSQRKEEDSTFRSSGRAQRVQYARGETV